MLQRRIRNQRKFPNRVRPRARRRRVLKKRNKKETRMIKKKQNLLKIKYNHFQSRQFHQNRKFRQPQNLLLQSFRHLLLLKLPSFRHPLFLQLQSFRHLLHLQLQSLRYLQLNLYNKIKNHLLHKIQSKIQSMTRHKPQIFQNNSKWTKNHNKSYHNISLINNKPITKTKFKIFKFRITSLILQHITRISM